MLPKSLKRGSEPISVATRMACKLMLLFAFTLAFVHLLGIVPDPKRSETQRKAVINETLAITSSLLTHYRNDEIIEKNLTAIVTRYPDIMSACIRRKNGGIVHQVGDHQKHWRLEPGAPSTLSNTYVPITKGQNQWGTVELSFAPHHAGIPALIRHPMILLGVFTVVLNGLIVRWYLARAFNYLDPAKSVPMHVRSTLNTFSEGVVVLDNEQRIVLANDKFQQHIGKTDQELLGHNIDDLPWKNDSEKSPPWQWRSDCQATQGIRLGLQLDQEHRTYLVNASAILGQTNQRRGTIASFDDITPLERKREELSNMLAELRSSRDELTLRNNELQYLATRDPLTGCINRRTFFEIFEKHWTAARRHRHSLSCFMVDLDHFKSVNDNHGHSVGDEVLRRAAETLQKTARDSDVVCRYGGEEFCVLLPQTDTDQACESAERMRYAIEQLEFEQLSVTASLGVSSIALGASDPQELLDQADKCLYVAKRNGRNQFVRWDEVPADAGFEETNDREEICGPSDEEESTSIPYPAVASLLSALAYKDADTAAHSTRVAELCVATASGLLSVKETYVLEIGALLHDIGKIGVPDSILLKPGPLTPKEWETMSLHDRIGVEIVAASFTSQKLIDIVRYHHATYEGTSDALHFPTRQNIPIGARIVAIADAYDAMVSNRVYRKSRPPEEAFGELRRCAGSQFDPELVERFIAVVTKYVSISLPITSKQIALQVGLQIERLAEAVDEQDNMGIKALATRLEVTAANGGIHEIEAVAATLIDAVDQDDSIAVLQMVQELMALCRSAQRVYEDVPPRKPMVDALPQS